MYDKGMTIIDEQFIKENGMDTYSYMQKMIINGINRDVAIKDMQKKIDNINERERKKNEKKKNEKKNNIIEIEKNNYEIPKEWVTNIKN